MRFAKNIVVFSTYCFLFSTVLGCASIKSPDGGPKDKDAPKILKAFPKNGSVNFSSKKISIFFDEYFNLENESNEISLSPALKKNLEFEIQKKCLVIKIKDSLEKNTTYKISFGRAISDVNERNVLKNYNYVFSTGENIDSLNIVGKVIDMYSQKPIQDVLVIVHPFNQDSLFKKKSASIFCVTDSAGKFSLNNLRKDSLNVYCLKDGNGNRFFNGEEEIGFYNKVVVPKYIKTDSIVLYSFKEKIKNRKITKKSISKDGRINVGFNKRIDSLRIQMLYPLDDELHSFYKKVNIEKDSLNIFIQSIENLDSIKFCLYEDEKDKRDTLIFRRDKKSKLKGTLKISNNLTFEKIKPKAKLILTSNHPIVKIQKERFELIIDTNKIEDFEILQKNLFEVEIKHKFKPNKKYKISLKDSALVGLNNIYSKISEFSFEQDVEENYGSIILKVNKKNLHNCYLLEIVEESNISKIVYQKYIDNNEMTIQANLIPTGKYLIRIINDANKNQKWDTGNFDKKINPESIMYIKNPLLVKSNWDIEEKIEIIDF